MRNHSTVLSMLIAVLIGFPVSAKTLKLDERPVVEGEWGYRPGQGTKSAVNPPSFSWRPQRSVQWEIECAWDKNFRQVEYRAGDIEYNVHCPPKVFRTGRYSWRYRGKDGKGQYTNWSKPRSFIIPGGYALSVKLSDGELKALLPTNDQATLNGLGMQTKGAVQVDLKQQGKPAVTMRAKY